MKDAHAEQPDHDTTRRNWQFSIRGAFVILTFLCVCAALIVGPRLQRWAHNRKISEYQTKWEALGGRVNYQASSDSEVTKLTFHRNLSSVPSESWKLVNLEELSLDFVQLKQMSPEIGKLKNLKTIWLEGNKLATLPPQIGLLGELRELHLYENRLTRLPPEIGQLTNLEVLDLRSNRLTTLPTEIEQLEKLQILLVEDNQFTEEDIARFKKALPKCRIYSDI